jgi:hypothetical protein
MRVVTDPIVDYVMYLIVQFLIPFIVGIVYFVANICIAIAFFVFAKVVGQEKASNGFQYLYEMVCLL